MNIEVIRKLLNSGNINDAKIGLILLKDKSAKEIYDVLGTGPYGENCFSISRARFIHLDFRGIHYRLSNNITVNLYRGGIIITKNASEKYEEL